LLMTLLTKIAQFHLKLFSTALLGRTFDSCMSLSIISGLELSNEDISIRFNTAYCCVQWMDWFVRSVDWYLAWMW
jgi:hypothetical protein